MTNLWPRTSKGSPNGGAYGEHIFNTKLAGLGAQLPFYPGGGPPQEGGAVYLTHPLAIGAGVDCPTCNLVEIPYNPNLPRLDYHG